MTVEVRHNGALLAIIIKQQPVQPGVSFVTQNDNSLQLATMQHPAGRQIQPHCHHPVERKIWYTQEVLVVQKGTLRVDFFSLDGAYLHSRLLLAGDVILLTENAGHGFEVIEDLEMLEIKQGPYAGDADKSRFARPENFIPQIVE